jgi:hypothetical protein
MRDAGIRILFRFAESVVNIAHVPKESLGLPPNADIGLGTDRHLLRAIPLARWQLEALKLDKIGRAKGGSRGETSR